MKTQPLRTVQFGLLLSEADDAVLSRFLSEINAMFEESNALMVQMGMPNVRYETPLTEQEAIQMLVASALERERKLQELQDCRNDPPWIRNLVREALQELKEGQ